MDEKLRFAQRLNELCDDMKVPPKGKNRQAHVAQLFNVSQKGARKWLEGEGFPSTENLIQIAKWGHVRYEWLLTGRGVKREYDAPQRDNVKALVRLAEGLPDYKVEQLIKIGNTIAPQEPANDDHDPDNTNNNRSKTAGHHS